MAGQCNRPVKVCEKGEGISKQNFSTTGWYNVNVTDNNHCGFACQSRI